MIKINGKFIFKKGENSPFSKHFSTKEFECRCSYSDCIDQVIDVILIDKLEIIRETVKMPVTVTSAFRCTKYQQHLRDSGTLTAVGKSQHELGKAADIKCSLPIDELEKICSKQFQAIGIAKNFLHLDLRTGKIRRWAY